ncbi:MAG: YjgB family protein [Solirubrobacterales bacterium]|nr:YjgB family protein [Solirubrobacterales bacterium]
MAQLVESNEIFKAKSKYLPTKDVLGMTSDEVRQTLGPPDRDQDISGVGVIWYYDLTDNVYQLIFVDGTVTTVNKY